ncbi:MAG: type I DNA topoisomerase, partial [Gammaproteobacteria bacterium]
MMSGVVVVESPAKCKTINKYLGKDYRVLASYGHVRDLLPKKGAVDPEHGFAMKYEVIEKNIRHVEAIAKALKKADTLYLATDPDREGEAISWHVHELLKERGLLEGKTVRRVVFHEITKRAITEAIEHPRSLSSELVDAQQARRALDYLVGFNLSPLLWKKVRRGLSAGRVQSPALRMIAERELEIKAFKPREYWTLQAEAVNADKAVIEARLRIYDGKKLEQFSIADEQAAHAAHDALTRAAAGQLQVLTVSKKKRQRKPSPPFITSTLQQEASRKLGFGASRTMRIAQQLYEGIDTGQGAEGLITYMRTDSVNLSQEALEDIRSYILRHYGEQNLPDSANVFKTKSKNAQEAHEAIRPTQVAKEPKAIKSFLTDEQFKLYDLIWKRALACQMVPAIYNTVTADLIAGSEMHQFRATGSTLVEPGFLSVYQEGTDEPDSSNDERLLPPMKKGES